MHAFTKFKFAKRVFLLLSEKIGISYKAKKQQTKKSAVLHIHSRVMPHSEPDSHHLRQPAACFNVALR